MKTIHGSASASAALSRGLGSWSGIGRVVTTAVTRAARTVLVWQEREFQRRALERFDEHALRDIGVSRADAVREVSKPFWRA